MSCFRLTKTNGERSKLFDDLFNIVQDESKAEELYSYFREPAFKNEIFGDYETHYKNDMPNETPEQKNLNRRIDENGEPKLFYLAKLNKHYYRDINNEVVFYPTTAQGLSKDFNLNDIKLFSEILALNFYKENIEFDYEKLEFINNSDKLLRDYIKDFIDAKIDELSITGDVNHLMRSIQLTNSKEYIDEWVNEVKDFFRSFKINYKIQDDLDAEEQEESTPGELMRKESFLKDSKDSVNNNVKLFLSLLESDKKNDFNESTFYSFDKVYSMLLKTLSNQVAVENDMGHLEDIYDDVYLPEIKKLQRLDPIFKKLYTKLINSEDVIISDDFKNQFVSAFRLFKNNFLASEKFIDENTGEITYDVKNISDVGSRKRNILSQWVFNYNRKNIKISTLKRKVIDLTDLTLKLSSNIGNITSEDKLLVYLNDFKNILNDIGVEFTIEGFDFFLNDLKADELAPISKASNLNKAIGDLIWGINNALETSESPITNQRFFSKLAEAEAFLQEEGSDASVFTVGKTKWVYSMPSFIDLKIATWKKNPSALIKHFELNDYNNSSRWMSYLTAEDVDAESRLEIAKNRLADVEVAIFNSIQQSGKSNEAVDNKGLSYIDSLSDYMNKVLAFRKGAKTYHKTALAAGKNTEYQIYFGDKEGVFNINTFTTYDEKTKLPKVDSTVTNMFFDYVNGEYKRIAKAHADLVSGTRLISNYHTGTANAFSMQFMKSLSPEKISSDIKIYDNTGKPIYDDLTNAPADTQTQILNAINASLSNNIKDLYVNLKKDGVFTYNEEGKLVNNAIDSIIYNSYKGSNIPLAIAGDVFVNSVVSQLEYSKMFVGDAAYYKNMEDFKKRVPSTYTDGLYMRLNNDEKYFNVSIIENVEIDSPALEELKKYLPEEDWQKYANSAVNSTDAQAWITPQRWKFILKRLGKWNSARDKVYQKMFQKNAEYSPSELKLLAQPLKGVYFDVVDGVPTYLKYSQAVLVPNLLDGTSLATLYEKMTLDKDGKQQNYHKQTHEVIVKDGIKVGAPANITKTHDENGNVLEDFNLIRTRLTNSYWKLQQDLPIKGFKDTDVGSQIQKNIFQGLTFNQDKPFYFNDDTSILGKDMIVHINNIVSALSNRGRMAIMKNFGIEEGTLKIKKESYLYSAIIKQLKSRKDVPANYIKALEAGISPYGIPGGFNLFQNVFSSIVNKEIIKIKTNGGGFIQMSDFGLSKSEASARGIKFTPWFNEANGKLAMPTIYEDINGNERLNPAGIFLPGSLIAKYIPNYRKLTSKELFGELNEETGKYEGGKIDQDILTNIIGYRIPNQGLSSNDALQVMGILPEEMGDTVIPYTGITTKTGSDFDIDKMYLMVPSFWASYPKEDKDKAAKYINDTKLSLSDIKDILIEFNVVEDIDALETPQVYDIFINEVLLADKYENNVHYDEFHNKYNSKRIASKLIYARPVKDKDGKELKMVQQPKEVLQNKLIEAYKSVLTSMHNISDVLSPVDDDFIKNDILSLVPKKEKADMLDFDAVSDLLIKNQFMSGKAGLGQNVNSLVDSVRGSMGQLSLNGVYLGWGFQNEEGDTLFDQEWSEELTKNELVEYVKSYNKTSSTPITYDDVKHLHRVKLFKTLQTLVNGFVDIEKDPYIVRGNWTTQTNNVGFMLLRAGAHPFKVNAFLAQPILREFIKYRSDQESKTLDNTNQIKTRFLINQGREFIESQDMSDKGVKINLYNRLFSESNIKRIGSRPDDVSDMSPESREARNAAYDERKESFFTEALKEITKIEGITPEKVFEYSEFIKNTFDNIFDIKPVEFNTLSLAKLRDSINGSRDFALQLSVLEKFEELNISAKVLAKSITASKVDVDGKGKNINSLIIARNRINNILINQRKKGNLDGFYTKLVFEGEDTLLKTYINNGLDFIYDVMRANPKYFFSASDMAVSSFNVISQKVYGSILDNEKLADKLENAYTTYILSGFKPLQTTQEDKVYLINEFPKVLEELQKDPNVDNFLINRLYLNESDLDVPFIAFPNVKQSVSLKNRYVDAWKELLEDMPEFGENLIRYAYITSGFNNTIGQFHDFIPYEWFNKNRFNSYLKNLGINKEAIDRQFVDQFFRHNHEDSIFMKPTYSDNMANLGIGDAFKTGYVQKKPNKDTPYLTYYELPESEKVYYYKLVGISQKNEGIYVRTSFLGYQDKKGNKVLEYNITTPKKGTKSVFPANKLTASMVNPELFNLVMNSDRILDIFDAGSVVDNETESKIQTKEIQPTPLEIKKEETEKATYNYNPTNVSEETRNEYKQYVIDKMGLPKVELGKNAHAFYFEDQTVLYVNTNGVMTYPEMTQSIVDLSKEDSNYDIKFMIGLNKIAEEKNIKSNITPTTKIISGGQTGVDMAGLDAGLELGIEIGGTAAANFTQSSAEKNKFSNLELRDKYKLKEGVVTKRAGKFGEYDDVYYQRTIDNAQEADGTIWFGKASSPGGKLTLGKIAQNNKPKPLINPNSAKEIVEWLNKNNIKTVNIAGNREHTNPGIYKKSKQMLIDAFTGNFNEGGQLSLFDYTKKDC